jgi:hypothetical protein
MKYPYCVAATATREQFGKTQRPEGYQHDGIAATAKPARRDPTIDVSKT